MIGLTGGIASGKSTVTNRLRELGAYVIDADEVSREVMRDPRVLETVRNEFGGGVFRADGSLDRAALARAAFASEEKTLRLELITHPAIIRSMTDEAREAEASGKYPLVFADAALLIESNLDRLCEGVWLVTADTETRIARAMERDGCSREDALLRISRQIPDEVKARYASVILTNDGTPGELIAKVDSAYEKEVSERLLRETGSDYEEDR